MIYLVNLGKLCSVEVFLVRMEVKDSPELTKSYRRDTRAAAKAQE